MKYLNPFFYLGFLFAFVIVAGVNLGFDAADKVRWNFRSKRKWR